MRTHNYVNFDNCGIAPGSLIEVGIADARNTVYENILRWGGERRAQQAARRMNDARKQLVAADAEIWNGLRGVDGRADRAYAVLQIMADNTALFREGKDLACGPLFARLGITGEDLFVAMMQHTPPFVVGAASHKPQNSGETALRRAFRESAVTPLGDVYFDYHNGVAIKSHFPSGPFLSTHFANYVLRRETIDRRRSTPLLATLARLVDSRMDGVLV